MGEENKMQEQKTEELEKQNEQIKEMGNIPLYQGKDAIIYSS